MVSLRHLKKPEELVWIAAGFGGGMGHQDLCGFLTAGIMAIGLHSGSLKMANNKAQARCRERANEYWNWWASMAPLHCRDIRKGRASFNICQRLGKLACTKLEGLLKA